MKKSDKEKLEEFQVLIDTREQTPWTFPNSIYRALPAGDYSIQYDNVSFQDKIIVERKSSVSELFAFSGRERDRFCRELEKMASIEYKYLIFEFNLMSIVNEQPPGILEPTVVYSTLCSFSIKYHIPFLFCGNRVNARGIAYKLLQFFFKYEVLKING